MTVVLVHDRPEAARPDLRNVPRVDGVVHYLRDVGQSLAAAGQPVVHLAVGAGLAADGSAEQGWITRPLTGVRRDRPAEADIMDTLSALRAPVLHLHGLYHVCPPAMLRSLSARWPTVMTLHDVGLFCPKGTRLRRDGRVCDRIRGTGCLLSGCHRPWTARKPVKEVANLSLSSVRIAAVGMADRVVCPSNFLADLAEAHGISSDRLRVLPNFSRYSPKAGPRPGSGRIVYAGRLEREKGFHILVEALERLADADWTLTILGEGSLAGFAARRLGPARVEEPGSVAPEDVARQFASADLAVLPYVMPESFGMAGVEALSLGCPVVGFPAGGAAEWMRPPLGAVPVPEGGAVALAAAIRSALADPPRVPETGFPYTVEAHVVGLRAIYDEARQAHG